VADKKLMFVLPESNDNVQLSARNVPSVLDVVFKDMNVYDIVNSEVLVLTESAAKVFADVEKAEA
jgi:large subunit ribosomal protein L4